MAVASTYLPRLGTTTLSRVSPNKPPMRRRTFYAPDDLWDAVAEKAAEEQENVADVIRDQLEQYLRQKPKPKPYRRPKP